MNSIKDQLHQMIDQIEDDKVLETINVVDYAIERQVLNQSTYEALIKEGEDNIASGRIYSHEEAISRFNQKKITDTQ